MKLLRSYGSLRLAGLAALLLVLAGSCSREAVVAKDAEPAGPPTVLAANYPLAYFAERIAGELARVEFPGPPDEDPAFWAPDRATLRRFQKADLLLLNGPDYSSWAGTLSLSLDRAVDTTASFRDRQLQAEGGVGHVHGPEGEGGGQHHQLTTWLDPSLAIEQAGAIARALARIDARHRATYEERLGQLVADLEDLGERLQRAAAAAAGQPLLASHPVYGYLARRLELDLRSVHFEPREHPDAEAWSELDRLLESHPAQVMIWEGAPLPETERELRGRGLSSVVFDPCASSPGSTDWLAIQRENASRLEEACSSTH